MRNYKISFFVKGLIILSSIHIIKTARVLCRYIGTYSRKNVDKVRRIVYVRFPIDILLSFMYTVPPTYKN